MQKTFSNDRTAFELRNMLCTWAPFFRRILQVYIYGGWRGRGEHAGISWRAYKYSNFAQRTQWRVHMWDNNSYRTTQLERFHSFSVGSPSPPTHPLDLSSLTFCTFTHKWRPWNWLLTINGHSELAPTRAPPTICPITKLGLLLVAGRRIGFWPVLGGSHFSWEPSVLVLYASMWEPDWFLIFLEISVGKNWPSSKYTLQFSQIQISTCFLKIIKNKEFFF
jgi:hypothetical protein